jgi:dihydroxyacetone kinase-like protein
VETLGLDWVLDFLRRAGRAMADARIDLIELDRAIGDGDHGENMDRGFTAVVARLDPPPADVQAALKLAAATLISTVGGAAGPLYGTAFLRAAAVAPARLDADAVAGVLAAALGGIVARGKAEVGDKTMVDAWSPAVEAASAAARAGEGPAAALRAAADAAGAGALATEPLVARKGRASYLGERSAGHRDPGAQSTALLLDAAAAAAEEAR